MIDFEWWPTLRYLLWGSFPDGPLGGAALTVAMSLVSALLSAMIGMALGVALSMTRGAVHVALTAIVGLFRAIPVLMLIFWTFFLMPILLRVQVPGLATVACALALVGGAYLSHSVQAGIAAVGTAQQQAAFSLGMTRWQALRYVLLPQAVRIMTPSFVNQWVAHERYVAGLYRRGARGYVSRQSAEQPADGLSGADLFVRRVRLSAAVLGAAMVRCPLAGWGAVYRAPLLLI
jgi:polar amino acid transport system permease protein